MARSLRTTAAALGVAAIAALLSPSSSNAKASPQLALPSAGRVVHSLGGCQIFPDNNWWNTKIKDLPIHKRSKDIIKAQAAGSAIHLDLGSTEEFYGIPVNVVTSTQPKVPIRFGVDGEDYRSESDTGAAPIPSNAQIESGSTSSPDPTAGDRHVIVVQQGTCQLTELYAAERVRDSTGQVIAWRAAAVAKWDLNSNALRPKYWTSADAAGLPILPGLLTYDEAASGKITHALRFTLPTARAAFIKPARHCGSAHGKKYPAYGMRFRLRKGFSAKRYHGPARAIVKAMKRYGLMYADQGSAMYVTGTSDPRWAGTLNQLRNKPIDGKNFRVVKTGKATVCP